MRRALARGAEHFNRGEYFEAHEVWEESWTHAPVRYRYFLQGLIHFAVAFHHHSRGNMEGFEKQITKGRKRLAGYLPEFEGVATRELYEWVVELPYPLLTISSANSFFC